MFSNKWAAWRTLPGWRGPSRDIGWLEGLAVEFVIYALEEKGFENSHVIVFSDNQGIIGAFDKGRSRNFQVNLSLRRACSCLAAHNLSLALCYIRSEDNPADPISRGILGLPSDRLHLSLELPKELTPFLERVHH